MSRSRTQQKFLRNAQTPTPSLDEPTFCEAEDQAKTWLDCKILRKRRARCSDANNPANVSLERTTIKKTLCVLVYLIKDSLDN
jgi:hypothetical protein